MKERSISRLFINTAAHALMAIAWCTKYEFCSGLDVQLIGEIVSRHPKEEYSTNTLVLMKRARRLVSDAQAQSIYRDLVNEGHVAIENDHAILNESNL